MNHIVTLEMPPNPSYAARRAAMADETRSRILDACVVILARGPAELSIPAVAREAGVSVPTVYRNFPDKKTLVAETAQHLKALRGTFHSPDQLSELPAQIRAQFEHAASVNETVRAAIMSQPILAARRDTGEQERRMRGMEALLGETTRTWDAADRRRAAMIATVLCSSATLQTFRMVTAASPQEAAETVIWTITRLLGRDSLEQPEPPAPNARKAKGTKR